MNVKPKLIVFASGTKDAGGSGFENLATSPNLDAEIVAVVSNHEKGGVSRRAARLGIKFVYFEPKQHSNILKNVGMLYRNIVETAGGSSSTTPLGFSKTGYRQENLGAEWIALSGWMRKVEGLDPARTFNIHPALLSFDHGRFGGKGMYGHHIHEAVKAALDAGEISESGFSMHFVTDEMDRGPIFFEHRIPLAKGMTAQDIERAVQKAEHQWQPKITNLVVHGQIRWDGKDPANLVVPPDYD